MGIKWTQMILSGNGILAEGRKFTKIYFPFMSGINSVHVLWYNAAELIHFNNFFAGPRV